MQLQYGPIGMYFTGQDEEGVWRSISNEESLEKDNKICNMLSGAADTQYNKNAN